MGFSLGEIFLLILVGIIVVGPKRLPGMMRTAGQWVARLRRMSSDLRSQSGIDDLLRQEGLDQHLHDLRSLSRMNVVDSLMSPAAPRLDQRRVVDDGGSARRSAELRPQTPSVVLRNPPPTALEPLRERECPLLGCDAGGALPDDAPVYPPAATVADAPPQDAPLGLDEGSAPKPPGSDGGSAPKPPGSDGGSAPKPPGSDGGSAPKPPAAEQP